MRTSTLTRICRLLPLTVRQPFTADSCIVGASQSGGSGRQRWRRGSNGQWSYRNATVCASLLAIPLSWAALKQTLGFGDLDKDPVVSKIKWALIYRRRARHDEALVALHDALNILQTESPTRTDVDKARCGVFAELADTYKEKGTREALESALVCYVNVYGGLVNLYGHPLTHAAVMRVELNIADVCAQLGRRVDAERGFRTVLDRLAVMVKHDRVEPTFEQTTPVHDPSTSTIADITSLLSTPKLGPHDMYASAAEIFATFLLDDATRSSAKEDGEAFYWFDQALAYTAHSTDALARMTRLNNFGVKCLWTHKFVKAVKYIGEAVRLGEQHLAIAESQLSGYYCNYAEALFHAGRRSEALQAAHRAVEIARTITDQQLLEHAIQFQTELEKEIQDVK